MNRSLALLSAAALACAFSVGAYAADDAYKTAKKQAEKDREQQKKVDEAAAKLKAAQDAYNAQLAKQDK